jgi:hypothetical protein
MKVLRFTFATVLVALMISCGGGDSNDDTTTDNTETDDTETGETDDTDTSDDNTTPNISGFDFNLNEGDFWEYEWDYASSTSYSGGGSNHASQGIFRITLGSPTVVGELNAYPLILSGNHRQDIPDKTPFVSPRWTHIAIHDNKIMMSSDGTTFDTVFDANKGYAIGFGFFMELSDKNLFEITDGSISNDYISGDAYVLTDSASESNCEYFPEHGTICGADVSVDYTMSRREYYQASVGPVGYYYDFSSSSGGTFDSVHTSKTIHIGLVASSLRGDVVEHSLESEPNDTSETASLISYSTLPITVKGDFGSQGDHAVADPENEANNHYLYLNARDENEPNDSFSSAEEISFRMSVHGTINPNDPGEMWRILLTEDDHIDTRIEDWYRITPTEVQTLIAELDFVGAPEGVDINLWLINENGETILEHTLESNPDEEGPDGTKSIMYDLERNHVYHLGVDIVSDADESDEARTDYTLSTYYTMSGMYSKSQVAIRDFYKVSLQDAYQLRISGTPSMGIFLTEPDGETVIASAPNSIDNDTTETVLETPMLEAGDYLIAIGSQTFHRARENRYIDKYEVTIDTAP